MQRIQTIIRSGTRSIVSLRPYKSQSLLNILNSYFVYQVCRYPALIAKTTLILDAAKKLKLTQPMYTIVRHTFFKHFCGGERLEDVIPTMRKFEASGIGSILDLAFEGDLATDEVLTHAKALATTTHNIGLFKESVDIAAHQSMSYIAIKVTAFIPATVLFRWSNSVNLLNTIFKRINKQSINSVEFAGLMFAFNEIDSSTADKLFALVDRNANGLIDWIDITDVINVFNPETHDFLLKPSKEYLNAFDIFEIKEHTELIIGLCEYGKEKRVRIMFDAEQSYFQPSIDSFALHMCTLINDLNSDLGPYISNTYQLYLKDGLTRLTQDVERAERNKYAIGIKIVRGAYMISERKLALQNSVEDPINTTIEDTHTAYDSAIFYLVSKLSEYKKSVSALKPMTFVVASHNRSSVERTVALMDQYSIPAGDGTVGFAQLQGMKDSITYGLADKGYKAYKYIPYGPIEVTIPFLIRRAHENKTLLNGSINQDQADLRAELKKRFQARFS